MPGRVDRRPGPAGRSDQPDQDRTEGTERIRAVGGQVLEQDRHGEEQPKSDAEAPDRGVRRAARGLDASSQTERDQDGTDRRGDRERGVGEEDERVSAGPRRGAPERDDDGQCHDGREELRDGEEAEADDQEVDGLRGPPRRHQQERRHRDRRRGDEATDKAECQDLQSQGGCQGIGDQPHRQGQDRRDRERDRPRRPGDAPPPSRIAVHRGSSERVPRHGHRSTVSRSRPSGGRTRRGSAPRGSC
jgi:hypothetical protein